MRYKTNEISEAGIDVAVELTPAWMAQSCPEFEGELAKDGLRLTGRIEVMGEDFLLRGKLQGGLQMQCGRCLESTRVPVSVDIAVQFVDDAEPHPQTKAKDEDEDDQDESDLVRFTDGVIDLTGELREEIFLAVPMTPSCEPECGGICTVCGRNRDHSPCECLERERMKAAPFAALARLKS